MKNMKKGVALTMALLMALSGLPANMAFAAEATTAGWTVDHAKFFYDSDGDGKYEEAYVDQPEEVPATCTEHSKTIYKAYADNTKAKEVGKDVVVDESSELAAHTKPTEPEKINVVPATCSKPGSHDNIYKCTVCGTVMEKETEKGVVDQAAHTAGTPVQENKTCTTYDEVTYCTVCKAELNRVKDKTLEKPEHTKGELVEEKCVDPTCTVDGKNVYVCSVCEVEFEEVVKATNHPNTTNDKVVVKEPTCTEKGSYKVTVKCTDCGATLEDAETFEVEALGHKWDEGVTDKEKGEITYTCKVCKEPKVEKIECEKHTPKTIIDRDKTFIAPTCTEAGSHYEKIECEKCGKELQKKTLVTVPATGHKFEVVPVEGEEPTCTDTGIGHEVCETCGLVKEDSEVVMPAAHKPAKAVKDTDAKTQKPATCTTPATYDLVVYCEVCDKELSRETGVSDKDAKPLGHLEIKEVTKEATCTTAGSAKITCARCKDVNRTEVIPALGHDFTVEIQDGGYPATCTKAGGYYKGCSRTGCTARTLVEIPAKGHTFDPDQEPVADIVFKEATCTTDGMKAMALVCKECNKPVAETIIKGSEEVIKADGHKITWEAKNLVKAPTCTETGLANNVKCTNCTFTQAKDYVIPATGHKFVKHEGQKPATCTEAGQGWVTCENCDYNNLKEVLPALGHKYVYTCEEITDSNWSLEPDGSGYLVITKACDNDPKDKTTTKVKFTLGENGTKVVKELTAEPTCEKPGKITYALAYTCEDGKTKFTATKTYEIPIVECKYDKVVKKEGSEKPATCEKDGEYVTETVCSWCGAVKKDSEAPVKVAKLGHIPETYTKETATADHKVGDLVINIVPGKEVTELEDGYYDEVVRCTREGCDAKDHIAQSTHIVVPATGHNPAAPVVENEVKGSCTDDCTYDSVVYCKDCEPKVELSRTKVVVKAAGHDYQTTTKTIVDPTCTEEGTVKVITACAECGKVDITAGEVLATIPAYGHVKSDVKTEVTKEATCTETGEKVETYYCLMCEKVLEETVEIPATGHVETEVKDAKEATDTEAGYTGDEVCKACGEVVKKGEVIPATGRPAAPVVTAKGIGSNTVQLTWDAVEGADGYMVYGQNADGGYHKLGLTSATSFVDEHASDINYSFYWVYAYKVDGNKVVASDASKYVFAKGVSCPAVTDLKATAGKGFVKLTWTASAGADGYIITGIRPGQAYANLGNTTNTTWTDTKADTSDYTFYWVFGYKVEGGKMVPGATAHYTYGKAR